MDASPPVPPLPAPVTEERSLFFADPALLDDPGGLVTFAAVMRRVAGDRGGLFVHHWLTEFAVTPHSERAGPAQLADDLVATLGPPETWDLAALPFRATGVHNRLDLAEDGHCGELRVSFASVHPLYQPLHVLVLFRQPAGDGDLAEDGTLTCRATARAWGELSALTGDAWLAAVRARIDGGLTSERFLMLETVELTVSPWEWRQWLPVPDPSGVLPFLLTNPPLFQTLDPEALNAPSPMRVAFLAFVRDNADALDARELAIPDELRRASVRVVQGIPRTPLDLGTELEARYPTLRQNLEIIGCPGCHTADAEFVQTRTDRTVSPFYEKELRARARYLEQIATGGQLQAPGGPLQDQPVLPP